MSDVCPRSFISRRVRELFPQIKPSSLTFHDPELEGAYRQEHASESVPYLRRFIVVVSLLRVLGSLLVVRVSGMPITKGIPFLREGGLSLTMSDMALVASGLLFAASFTTAGRRHLRPLTAVLFLTSFMADAATTTFRADVGIAVALVEILFGYLALRLLFLESLIVAGGSTVAYVAGLAGALGMFDVPTAGAEVEFALYLTLLGTINITGILLARHFELVARVRFHQTRLVREQHEELARTVADLKETQAHLVEAECRATQGRLVSGLLHELNSPLGTLRSASDTVERALERLDRMAPRFDSREQEHEARHWFAAIHKLTRLQRESGERIGEVAEGLKCFVHLDASERQALDVRQGVKAAMRLLGPRLGGVQVHWRQGDEPLLVDCYPARLNQAFSGVLENATNALDGAGELFVSVTRSEGEAVVTIRDTGPGIPESVRDELFQLGFSREGGRVRLRLGLARVRHAVEEVGGKVELESVAEEGTTVRIRLPLAVGVAAD